MAGLGYLQRKRPYRDEKIRKAREALVKKEKKRREVERRKRRLEIEKEREKALPKTVEAPVIDISEVQGNEGI